MFFKSSFSEFVSITLVKIEVSRLSVFIGIFWMGCCLYLGCWRECSVFIDSLEWLIPQFPHLWNKIIAPPWKLQECPTAVHAWCLISRVPAALGRPANGTIPARYSCTNTPCTKCTNMAVSWEEHSRGQSESIKMGVCEPGWVRTLASIPRCILTQKPTAEPVLWLNAHRKWTGLNSSGISVSGSTVTLRKVHFFFRQMVVVQRSIVLNEKS